MNRTAQESKEDIDVMITRLVNEKVDLTLALYNKRYELKFYKIKVQKLEDDYRKLIHENQAYNRENNKLKRNIEIMTKCLYKRESEERARHSYMVEKIDKECEKIYAIPLLNIL